MENVNLELRILTQRSDLLILYKTLETSEKVRDFPSGPVAKTPSSQCRRAAFDPWSGEGSLLSWWLRR